MGEKRGAVDLSSERCVEALDGDVAENVRDRELDRNADGHQFVGERGRHHYDVFFGK